MREYFNKEELARITRIGGRKCASYQCHTKAIEGDRYCQTHKDARITGNRLIQERFSLRLSEKP